MSFAVENTPTLEAAVFSVELADALVADFVGCARGVHAIQANQVLVDLVSSFAAQKKVTPAQIALARLPAKKPLIVPILGTTKLARLEENLGAATVELTTEDVRALEEPSSKIKLEGARYPKFHEQLVGR